MSACYGKAEEIPAEQIHLTIFRQRPRGEEWDYCFKLSTVSARRLVQELEAAIRKREI